MTLPRFSVRQVVLVNLLFVVLIVFGFLNGRQIRNKDLPKPLAMFVHIGIFCTSVLMIWLVQTKPF